MRRQRVLLTLAMLSAACRDGTSYFIKSEGTVKGEDRSIKPHVTLEIMVSFQVGLDGLQTTWSQAHCRQTSTD